MVNIIGQIIVELANRVIGESRKVANSIDTLQVACLYVPDVFMDFHDALVGIWAELAILVEIIHINPHDFIAFFQ